MRSHDEPGGAGEEGQLVEDEPDEADRAGRRGDEQGEIGRGERPVASRLQGASGLLPADAGA